ncbi:MAG: DUF1512 domain-containing protein [Candidatus Nanohaloarchaeota archaeon QJJ-7]|nr:DUF1512 domain-containing protein [Candidatus Nanohaloarchaeota archaeon QJJ-7]
MVLFGMLGGEQGVLPIILNMALLLVFFALLPRLMIWRSVKKIEDSLHSLQEDAVGAETKFLEATGGSIEDKREKLEPMKNMVVSPPTGIDPAGLVDKLEHLLDLSDDKMERFVETLSEELDEEEKDNLKMAFRGVYGTNQLYVLIRHFRELIKDMKNYQLAGMVQLMLPLYEEIAEAQREATEAFVDGVPIGDSVGPLVAAKFMSGEVEELAENVVASEEEVDGKEVHVLKSKGPAARLGKYGDAIEELVEENDIQKIVFVDAGMRFEGEDTGKVVDGAGVLMGGPGVEKFKIEEVATEHDVPMEGFIVKQSGPQASRPMHSEIYHAVSDVVGKVEDEIEDADGPVLLVGVGNTSGVGNTQQSTSGIPNKLKPYWDEEEEESTSYYGLMKAFPMGGGDFYGEDAQNTFELFQSLVR